MKKPKYKIGQKVITPKGKGKIIQSMYYMSTPTKFIDKYCYLVKHKIFKRWYWEEDIKRLYNKQLAPLDYELTPFENEPIEVDEEIKKLLEDIKL